MKSLSPARVAAIIVISMALILIIVLRGSGSGDVVAEPVSSGSAEASASPAAPQPSRISSGVVLPISDSDVDRIVTVSQRVVVVLANPNLSADEQNNQTAALATGNLVLDGHRAPPTQQPVDPVTVQGFEYMSATQVQVRAAAGSLKLFLTFAKPAGQWLVDDVTSNGCATGAACPFDPAALPPLAGSDE